MSWRGTAFVSGTAALVVLAGLAACGGSGDEADLADITWTLTELEGRPPIAGATIDLTLSTDGRVFGSGGCNRYTGPANFGEGEMTLGPNLAVTRMACEEQVMAQEDVFVGLLQRVSGYEVADGELRLMDAEGTVLARFQ